MNKPLIWLSTLSSALHTAVDNVVADELRTTTSNICHLHTLPIPAFLHRR
jgi:hypothetical protein